MANISSNITESSNQAGFKAKCYIVIMLDEKKRESYFLLFIFFESCGELHMLRDSFFHIYSKISLTL